MFQRRDIEFGRKAWSATEPAVLASVVVWSLAMLLLAVTTGVRHDYVHYIEQWRLLNTGTNPWATDNAYGPFHLVLGGLLPLGELAPKVAIVAALLVANALLVLDLFAKHGLTVTYRVFPLAVPASLLIIGMGVAYGLEVALAAALLIANALLVICLVVTRGSRATWGVYLLAVPVNALVIGAGVTYGLNDGLAAALIVLAVVLRFRGYLIATGVALGLAVLLKYYPLLLVPLFALDDRTFDWRVVLGAALTCGAGFVLAFGVWGGAFLQPILFGVERKAKLLSILSALDSAPYLVGGRSVLGWLVRTNAFFVVGAAAVAIALSWWNRLHWLEASVFALLAVLLTYKVGNQQFFIPWLFLVAALPLAGTSSADRLAVICVPMVVFLSAFHWGYEFGSDQYRQDLPGVRQYAGFAAFPLGVVTIAVYLTAMSRARRLSGKRLVLAPP